MINKILFAVFGWQFVEWKYARMMCAVDNHNKAAKQGLADIDQFIGEIKGFAKWIEEDK